MPEPALTREGGSQPNFGVFPVVRVCSRKKTWLRIPWYSIDTYHITYFGQQEIRFCRGKFIWRKSTFMRADKNMKTQKMHEPDLTMRAHVHENKGDQPVYSGTS